MEKPGVENFLSKAAFIETALHFIKALSQQSSHRTFGLLVW